MTMKKFAAVLLLLSLSITMFVVEVESKKKHHHKKQSNLDVLNGERKENVYMAPDPDVGYFATNRNPSPPVQKIGHTPKNEDGGIEKKAEKTLEFKKTGKYPNTDLDETAADLEESIKAKEGKIGKYKYKITENEINRKFGIISDMKTVPKSKFQKRTSQQATHLWPKDGGQVDVAFLIDNGFSKIEEEAIMRSTKKISDAFRCGSLVRINAAIPGVHYVKVTKGAGGCSSYVGTVESFNISPQELSLGNGCVHPDAPGIVEHEFLHALGFGHEHQRTDRNAHVIVHQNNIEVQYFDANFPENPTRKPLSESTAYDYESVMHYASFDFAIDQTRLAIETIDATKQDIIGQRNGLSLSDIEELNNVYECPQPKSLFEMIFYCCSSNNKRSKDDETCEKVIQIEGEGFKAANSISKPTKLIVPLKRLKSSEACTTKSRVCFTVEYTRNDEKAPVLEIIGGKSGWYRSDPKLLVEAIKLDFMDPFDKCSADFEITYKPVKVDDEKEFVLEVTKTSLFAGACKSINPTLA